MHGRHRHLDTGLVREQLDALGQRQARLILELLVEDLSLLGSEFRRPSRMSFRGQVAPFAVLAEVTPDGAAADLEPFGDVVDVLSGVDAIDDAFA